MGLLTVWMVAATLALAVLVTSVNRLREELRKGFAKMAHELDDL